MGVLDLTNQQQQEPASQERALAPATTFGEVVESSFEATRRNFIVGAKGSNVSVSIADRDIEYKRITGRSIYDDAREIDPNVPKGMGPGRKGEFINKAVDRLLEKRRMEDPEKFKSLLTFNEIEEDVRLKAKKSLETQEKVRLGAEDSLKTTAGSVVGALGASLLDPINMATLPLGAGAGRTIVKAALIEAAINMSVEAASQPFIADWQKELGNEYGFKEMAQNVGLAGLFGGGLTVGLKSVSKVIGFTQMSRRFDDLGEVEASGAAKYMEKVAHIDEANLSRADTGIDFQAHKTSIEETNAAFKSGRAIEPDKIPIKNKDFLEIDPKKINDPTMRAEVIRFQEGMGKGDIESTIQKSIAEIEPVNPKSIADEVLQEVKAERVSLKRQKEIEALYESPQARAQEFDDFEQSFKDQDDLRIFDDEEAKDFSISEIKKQFKDDSDFLDAISSCGVGS